LGPARTRGLPLKWRGPALPPVAESLVGPILAGARFSARAVLHPEYNPEFVDRFVVTQN